MLGLRIISNSNRQRTIHRSRWLVFPLSICQVVDFFPKQPLLSLLLSLDRRVRFLVFFASIWIATFVLVALTRVRSPSLSPASGSSELVDAGNPTSSWLERMETLHVASWKLFLAREIRTCQQRNWRRRCRGRTASQSQGIVICAEWQLSYKKLNV